MKGLLVAPKRTAAHADAHWKNAAPAWLMPWLLPDAPWSLVVVAALGCAVLATVSTAFVRRVLPTLEITIAQESLRWTIVRGLVGFAMLGLLLLVLSAPIVADRLRGH